MDEFKFKNRFKFSLEEEGYAKVAIEGPDSDKEFEVEITTRDSGVILAYIPAETFYQMCEGALVFKANSQ